MTKPEDKLRLERLTEEKRAVVERDLEALPEVPSKDTLFALISTAMNTHIKGVDLWNIGKHLQAKHDGMIPWKTECEVAAGLWYVVRKEILEARARKSA